MTSETTRQTADLLPFPEVEMPGSLLLCEALKEKIDSPFGDRTAEEKAELQQLLQISLKNLEAEMEVLKKRMIISETLIRCWGTRLYKLKHNYK